MTKEFCDIVNYYRNFPPYSYEWWLYWVASTINTSDEVIETVARMCFEKGDQTCVWHEYAQFLQIKCKCAKCKEFV